MAAGLGTRLYPLTSDKPKALVELNGVTLLERAIRKVSELNPSEIVVNIHHFGDQVLDFLQHTHNFNLPIVVSDERAQLLDTGGAILKARDLLGNSEPFLVYNVDVLSSIDLKALWAFHQEKNGLATLAVRERITDRYLLFNERMELSGWRNKKTGEEILARSAKILKELAFCGIQIIQPEIFAKITESGRFSVIQLYLRLAQQEQIYGYHDTSDLWMDLGKPEHLAAAEKIV